MPYIEERLGTIKPNTMSIAEAKEQWLEEYPVSDEDIELFFEGSDYYLTEIPDYIAYYQYQYVAFEALRRWTDLDVYEYINLDEPEDIYADNDTGSAVYKLDFKSFLEDNSIKVPYTFGLWRRGWEFSVLNGTCDWIDDPHEGGEWTKEDRRFSVLNALGSYIEKVYGDNPVPNELHPASDKYNHVLILSEFNRVMTDPALMITYLKSHKNLDEFPVFTAIVEKHRIKD